jgi:hypothetical protein
VCTTRNREALQNNSVSGWERKRKDWQGRLRKMARDGRRRNARASILWLREETCVSRIRVAIKYFQMTKLNHLDLGGVLVDLGR